MERRPREETYPRGARGWVESAQAAMETKSIGAFPHCCLFVCFLRDTGGRVEKERHMNSEKGFWGPKLHRFNIWKFPSDLSNLFNSGGTHRETLMFNPIGKRHLFTLLKRVRTRFRLETVFGEEVVIPSVVKWPHAFFQRMNQQTNII